MSKPLASFMFKKRLLVFISGTGSNFKAIHQACCQQKINAHLIAVISDNPQALGLRYAEEQRLATAIVPKAFYASKKRFDETLLALVHSYRPDLIALAGYMRILTPEFVAGSPCPIVNIHPSLLPQHKGLHTHERVLEEGDRFHGLTIHRVTAELDAGPIIVQVQTPVHPTDQSPDLQAKIQKMEHFWYPEILSWWGKGQLIFTQNTILLDHCFVPPHGITACTLEGIHEVLPQNHLLCDSNSTDHNHLV